MNKTKYILLAIILLSATQACESSKQVSKKKVEAKPITIVLSDQPLDTIKKHVENQRWQVLYSIGGLTGDDKNNFEELYYTFSGDGKMTSERKGVATQVNYSWKHQQDIYTGDSTYVLFTGLAGWVVDGIYKDTLRMSDNHPDGYRYTLVKTD